MSALFLVQLFGLYLIIVGGIVLVRKKSVMGAIRELSYHKSLIFVLALFELIAGLALILAYPVMAFTLEGIVALVGWILLLESILYLALPFEYVERIFLSFNKPLWYVGGGIVSIVLGIALTLYGFGIL